MLQEGLTGGETDTSLTQFSVRLVSRSVSLQSPSKVHDRGKRVPFCAGPGHSASFNGGE